MQVELSITLGNYSATPSLAQVRFRIYCISPAEMGPPGLEPTGVKSSLFWIGLPFTNANKIANLTLQTHGA